MSTKYIVCSDILAHDGDTGLGGSAVLVVEEAQLDCGL
jgi:hypothetical protein